MFWLHPLFRSCELIPALHQRIVNELENVSHDLLREKRARQRLELQVQDGNGTEVGIGKLLISGLNAD